MKSLAGKKLNAGRGYVQFGTDPKQQAEFHFDYWSRYAHYNIPSYKSGEKIFVVFKRERENDGFRKEYTFEIPLFEQLVREGKRLGHGEIKKLYDTEKNPLKLRDTQGEVTMTFGIEKLKFHK